MRCLGLVFLVFVLIASCIIMPLPVKADSKALVVPDDFPNLSSAVENATNGDKIFVKYGTYDEPINQTLIIDKSITVIGEEAERTIINLFPAFNVTWVVTHPFYDYPDGIRIQANDVKLSNLTITISPGGNIRATGNRIQLIGNNIKTGSSITGILLNGNSCNITDNLSNSLINMKGVGNVLFRNQFDAIHLGNAQSNTVSLNKISYLALVSSNHNIVYDNDINTYESIFHGARIENSSDNIFRENSISVGRYGTNLILSGGAANNTFFHNNFLGEDNHVSLDASIQDFWDNGMEGNYWQNYNGTDTNGDGIGDTPYVIDADNVDHYPLVSPWTGSLPSGVGLGVFQVGLIATVVVLVGIGVLLLAMRSRRSSASK
jgi:hypothetical protein